MNEQFKCKLQDIFEESNFQKIDTQKVEEFEKLTSVKLPIELLYIIERYEGAYVKDGIGFKGVEISPFAFNGYEVISYFLGFSNKTNLFTTYNILKQQLPKNMVPIAEMDGGNYICMDSDNKIYVWLHDVLTNEGCFLASNDIVSFIDKFESIPEKDEDIDLNKIVSEYSDDFWE